MILHRSVPGRSLIAAAAIAVATGTWACRDQADPALRTVRILDLITASTRATIREPGPEYVDARSFAINGQSRRTLYMHAAASAEFSPIEMTEHSVFTAFIGFEGMVFDKEGDGVEFSVSVTVPDDVVVKVFSRYMDPRRQEEERGWVGVRVPLGAFAGQQVRIALATTPGPAGDNRYDSATWGDPQLILDALVSP